jgi:hypothetical protein
MKFFAIENPSEEDLAALNDAQGRYLNSPSEAGHLRNLAYLCAAVTTPVGGRIGAYTTKLGRWFANRIEEDDLPDAGAFDKVFTCGIHL